MITLLDRGKRGFFRGIFSRTTVIAILLILQILFFVASYHWFQTYKIQFEIFEITLAILTVLYLINSDMDSTAVITWLLILVPFPLIGSLFLLYTKQDFGFKAMRAGIQRTIDATQPYLIQDAEAILELKNRHSNNYNLVSYLENSSGHFPVYRQTDVTYFSSGEEKFKVLKEELRKAKKYIFLEYFIIGEGLMWGEILAILEEKAAEGVEVRVMYDGMIEFSTLSFDYTKRLEKLGIKAKAFAPLSPFISTYYNYRDHRKILVIDGKVAFTGGINLADEYINQTQRFGHWKDTAIMLKGRAVDTFTILFLQMWHANQEEVEVEPYLALHEHRPNNGFIIPYGDSPLDDDKIGENVYIDILNQARDYVHIMTPYLILDGELAHALKFAAQRGVDVKIIMPGIADKKLANALAKTYYATLIKAGVKIYEYTPGFIHAKVFVSDRQKAVVGTINLDYRSLYHHFECATYLYQVSCIPQIENDFQATLLQSHLVSLEEVNNRPFINKAIGTLAKTIAPLM